ncbi:MAG: type VI secretion system protein IglI family protein [Methylobacter sp.]|uniref:type VI secretion system protein IglI family protein n=1 Tax=Methylobacter sp. TaxID=2051955 RepID=UPI00272F156E|nr:type VI secretion system protein IglI family protein [Methylobacter sp.]MDP1666298.1 type VI secretion system protein IglI family protein [Methylobacter sp.]
MRIELLQGGFPVTENPGLDSTDLRFDEITTLVQAGKYAEAASLSEAILAEGIYDIRLICYFLYGYWLEEGLASILEVINCVNNALLENWEAIGPVTRREKIFEKSLDWLFKQLLKKIQYEENKNTALWQQWQARFNADDMNNMLELGEIFRSGINHRLEDKAGAVIGLWSKIEEWLRIFQQLMYRPAVPVQTEPEQTEDDSTEVDVFPAMAVKITGLEMESSYHMELLLKKLAAFERLLKDEKFPRAALMAVDINETLSNFDPKIYFPKIFETFVRLQALNFEELSSYVENQDSPQWQVMQDWLKVDVDSFINN